MKHLSKIFLLAILVVFASCQNDTLDQGASSIVEEELAMEDQILVSDGEEDETFVLNQDLTTEMPAPKLSFTMSSDLSNGSSDCTPDLEGFVLSLPDSVSITTTEKRAEDAYFILDILDTNLAGTDLLAWCADIDLSLEVEGPLDFAVYSSYSDNIPDTVFAQPENLDIVNWILNQDYVGTESPNGGTYTYGHVQWVIWELLNSYNCNICSNLTNPIGTWRDDSRNLEKAKEILEAALANGEDFTPGCGEKVGVVLVPDGKQPLIVMKDVPELEVPCSDCEGKVTSLELEFDWHNAKKIDIVQRYENTCYGKRVYCNTNAQPGEKISISGTNHDGTFGSYIYIYINNCYYTKIKTNCDTKIGPGYFRGVFNVISGESSHGGELCEYVNTYHCQRYWW